MIRYSNKASQLICENTPPASSLAEHLKENCLPQKTGSCKPVPLALPRYSHNQSQVETVLTPKTARTHLERTTKYGEGLSRSINATPDKERSRKDHSFLLNKTGKQSFAIDFKIDYNLPPNAINYNVKTDRSQRIFRNRDMNNESAIRGVDDLAKLRQTVCNEASWQGNFTSGASTQRERQLPNLQLLLKRKVQSQFNEPKKEIIKSKFASKQHSRNNSRTIQYPLETAALTERLQMLGKTPPKTPRVSQDKPMAGIAREKAMSQTDSAGSYFQLSLSRKITTPKPAQLRIDDFTLGACKGEGRFGKVYPAVHKKTGFLLAIKKVAKQAVRLMQEQFAQEIKLNLYLSHPNIVRMFGCFSDLEHIYILMEYMEEGSLYKHVKLAKRFSEEEASTKLLEICEAVRYLHSSDILHRDIKPENIVLSNGVCKLCDFGWATYSRERRNTYCGTLDYVCPEILEGESYDSFVDIWAIGVLAFEMLVGKAPFYHISRKQTMKSIMNCEFSFPSDMSVVAKLFIMKALQRKPDQRFTIDSLLRDRFLSQVPRYDY